MLPEQFRDKMRQGFSATMTYLQGDRGLLPGPLENGSFRLRFRQAPPALQCETTWPSTPSQVGLAIPPNITPAETGFGVQGLVIRIDYFIQIHTE